MNYRHTYHAGSFTDAFKHIALIALIQSLLHKDTPFCYLETHAGIGSYDLLSVTAQKTKEFEMGVKKIFTATNPPALIQDYLSCIKKLNPDEALRHYPGSPYFAQHFMRPDDRAVLSELHPDDAHTLKRFFARDKQISVHAQDGYQSLVAFLPPKERRGLVLIDPPYEKPDELMSLPRILAQTIKRWDTGIYAVWFPIKNRLQIDRFYRELKTKISRPMLFSELCIYPEDVAQQLNGCGMVIINPPWQLDLRLKEILPWLWKTLSVDKQGHFRVE
ncbi:MAG: 23S rRNA (adenine(2030)-N(6))-methyltransferase RlmJ [Gammaproteobacteria bacterium]